MMVLGYSFGIEYSKTYLCSLPSKMMSILPVSPVSAPVPESGTTVMVSDGLPRAMMPVCCSAKLPCLPCNAPVRRSTAE